MVLGIGALGNGTAVEGYAVTVDGQSDPVLNAARLIEVDEQLGDGTTYRIDYEIDIEEDDIPRLIDSRLAPGSELSILVSTTDRNYCLVKGPIHAQEIHLQHGGAGSLLTVIGSDRSIEMDRETRTAIWADVTDSDAVTSILSGYGFTPDIETTTAGHYTDKHALVQRDSDLRFVRRLAQRNGFLFWITYDEMGLETAHFKSPPVEGEAETTLVINNDQPHLQSLELVWDVEQPTSVVSAQLDLNDLSDMDGGAEGSPLTVLADQDLQQISGEVRSIHLHAPADDTGDMQSRSRGLLVDANWFIRATCQTSLHLIGKVIQAHTLVAIQGAGSRFSGKYLVAGTRHRIDSTEHQMELTLVRNGWM
jgi:hypothetical protein